MLLWGQSTCHSLWQGDFTHNRKQVVNRLKIPKGFLELLARPSSVRILGGFVVLFSSLLGSVLLRVVFIGLLSSLTGSF